ncbi:MAG: Uma2 family endonuclease [Methylococcaceae bacterium]|nr:MAG: Uma2 family endonuclease [Methylococcaceae bacterium]
MKFLMRDCCWQHNLRGNPACPDLSHCDSADDYLACERLADERHQLVNGEIFAMAGESLVHSTICVNLIISLGSQLRGKPCRALSPNLKIRTGPLSARSTKGMFSYADVTVVCGEPRFHDRHCGRIFGLHRRRVSAVNPLFEEKRHIHQRDHHGHFDQWPDHGGKRGAAIDAEHRHGNGYRQLEIVAGGGKGQRGGFAVIGADGFAQRKAD